MGEEQILAASMKGQAYKQRMLDLYRSNRESDPLFITHYYSTKRKEKEIEDLKKQICVVNKLAEKVEAADRNVEFVKKLKQFPDVVSSPYSSQKDTDKLLLELQDVLDDVEEITDRVSEVDDIARVNAIDSYEEDLVGDILRWDAQLKPNSQT